jgi:hypothetical protein
LEVPWKPLRKLTQSFSMEPPTGNGKEFDESDLRQVPNC